MLKITNERPETAAYKLCLDFTPTEWYQVHELRSIATRLRVVRLTTSGRASRATMVHRKVMAVLHPRLHSDLRS